ncbi:hypothetical protein V474_15645 [Novosphingobium barchaimii LL02]|uniref:Uncharacterized protein n=2 Tax=Novosphingobium barchaimii TaxID=1420591 RepID=A0A0J7XYP5_9SPHN|nr:hypothetical protein V474_15645 [Novosphingobium barchaimii LL02]
MCSRSSDPDSEWPDMMNGIMGSRIVSVVTPHETLDTTVWSCSPSSEEDHDDSYRLCHVRSADAATQKARSESWLVFMNSLN